MSNEIRIAVSELIEKSKKIESSLNDVNPDNIDRDNWETELGEFLDLMEDLENAETRVYECVFNETSGKGRIREYLRDKVGEPVKSERISRISGISQYARRIRELRNEEGFVIDSTRTREELGQNDYFIVEIRDVDEKSRITAQTRYEQLKKQDTCEICGRSSNHPDVKYMEVDHIESFVNHSDPDEVNNPENLRTLCNECHHGKSASDNIANER